MTSLMDEGRLEPAVEALLRAESWDTLTAKVVMLKLEQGEQLAEGTLKPHKKQIKEAIGHKKDARMREGCPAIQSDVCFLVCMLSSRALPTKRPREDRILPCHKVASRFQTRDFTRWCFLHEESHLEFCSNLFRGEFKARR